MKSSLVKKIAVVSCLLIATSFASVAQAAGCKVKVKYSNGPFNSKTVGSERYKVSSNSTSTTLRKHMRVITNDGAYDVSIKYWDVSGNHWTIVKKGTTRRVSGDLKKIKCPKPKLEYQGKGFWRTTGKRPKGKYSRVENVSKSKCKKMCLVSDACTGIEYSFFFKNRNKSICELHTDKFHHLGVNDNPEAQAAVWLKK